MGSRTWVGNLRDLGWQGQDDVKIFHGQQLLGTRLHPVRRGRSQSRHAKGVLPARRAVPVLAGIVGDAWIQVSSATVDLKSASSSAMASAGVLQPRVFLGRLFIRFAISMSHVWLASLRSAPYGINWRSKPLVFSLLPRCRPASALCAGRDM